MQPASKKTGVRTRAASAARARQVRAAPRERLSVDSIETYSSLKIPAAPSDLFRIMAGWVASILREAMKPERNSEFGGSFNKHREGAERRNITDERREAL